MSLEHTCVFVTYGDPRFTSNSDRVNVGPLSYLESFLTANIYNYLGPSPRETLSRTGFFGRRPPRTVFCIVFFFSPPHISERLRFNSPSCRFLPSLQVSSRTSHPGPVFLTPMLLPENETLARLSPPPLGVLFLGLCLFYEPPPTQNLPFTRTCAF